MTLEPVAKAIFEKCQELGIEEVIAYSIWDETSEQTRDMYREVAKAAIDAYPAPYLLNFSPGVPVG